MKKLKSAVKVPLPKFRVKGIVKAAPAAAESSINEESRHQPLPEEIVTLHKAVGPDGLSNDKFWGDQGWLNLNAVKRRLLSLKEQFTEEIYNTLFGYQELPQGYENENLGALRREGGVAIVPCMLAKTHEKEGKSQEFAARWMAWVGKDGNLVYRDANGQEFNAPAEGRTLKRTGVYTTSISVKKDGRGKPVSIDMEKTGLRIVCGRHQHVVKATMRLPFLSAQDAAIRLEGIINKQQEYLSRGATINEDLVASFGQDTVSRSSRRGDQMERAFKNPKGNRRPQRR